MMRQNGDVETECERTIESFWFRTECMHEFLINIEFIRTLPQLRKLMIKDFNIINLGSQFSRLMISLVESDCLKQLQSLGLVNVNLQQYI